MLDNSRKEQLNNALNLTISECEKHIMWLNSAFDKIVQVFPLTATAYHNLNPSLVPLIDQYVYRFTKLQDVMGAKLFITVLSHLAEDIKTLSFIDILNRLEQLTIIESKDDWLYLRNLRNRVAHEYDDPTNAEILNALIANKEKLVNYYINVNKFIQAHLMNGT